MISGVTGSVGKFLKSKPGQSAVKFLTEKIPSRIVNSILRPQNKAFDFGRDPGKGVVEEGIVASTRGSLLTKIGQKKQRKE